MAIISLQRKTGRVESIKVVDPREQVGDRSFLRRDLNPSLVKFQDFWTLMDTVHAHGYIRAAMSVIGRSAIGAWWGFRKHSEFGNQAKETQRKKLYLFYMHLNPRSWDNIKDYYSIAHKLMIGVMYLKYFGQVAYEIIRDSNTGKALGLDFLPGLVLPNVDENGKFRDIAFVQYISRDARDRVEFRNPKDIVYISNPDWEGNPFGSGDVESLARHALPLDLYLQSAATSYMENRDTPEIIFELSPEIADESFDDFVEEMRKRYSGTEHVGKSMYAVQGEMKIHELRRMPSGLPYQEARDGTRQEILAVSGTPESKLGLTKDTTNSNIREIRREFHESTMISLFRMIEMAFYEQIHVREFGLLGWEFKFNNPDFLNAVERATVHMRYHQMAALNPNEIRAEIGKQPRTDPLGDIFLDQLESDSLGENPQGNPPDGRPVNPDDPSQIGEPTTDEDDPVRGDQHDEEIRLLDEIRRWRNFAINRVKRGRKIRKFNSSIIHDDIIYIIQPYLENAADVEDVVDIFNSLLTELKVVGDGFLW